MKSYLLTLIFFVNVLVSYSQTYPVVWTNPINVTVNGDNTLTKTVATGAWDATVVSQNILLSGLDGYAQFTFPGGSYNYMVSLSRLNNDPSYVANDYSNYINYQPDYPLYMTQH